MTPHNPDHPSDATSKLQSQVKLQTFSYLKPGIKFQPINHGEWAHLYPNHSSADWKQEEPERRVELLSSDALCGVLGQRHTRQS